MKRSRGRPRKFKNSDLALYHHPFSGKDELVVIVDRKVDPTGRKGRYGVVRMTRDSGGRPHGRRIWAETFHLDPWPGKRKRNRKAYATYRTNSRIEAAGDGRGCNCQCCPHVALAPREVRPDGTFAWEATDEDDDVRSEDEVGTTEEDSR